MQEHRWQESYPQEKSLFPDEASVQARHEAHAFNRRIADKVSRLILYGVLYALVCVIVVLINVLSPSASDIAQLRMKMTTSQVLQTSLGRPASINREVRVGSVMEQWVYPKVHGWLLLDFQNDHLVKIHDQQGAQ